MIKGKKTYIVAVAMVLYAISSVVLDKMEISSAIELILAAAAFAGLRNGIKDK